MVYREPTQSASSLPGGGTRADTASTTAHTSDDVGLVRTPNEMGAWGSWSGGQWLSAVGTNAIFPDLSQFLQHNLIDKMRSPCFEYLRTEVIAKNQEKLQELVGYIEKHQSEIINYNRRRQAGKTIGSGRMEKGVDLAVGHRQKNKGMSWRSFGSKALSLLKLAELNNQWQQL